MRGDDGKPNLFRKMCFVLLCEMCIKRNKKRRQAMRHFEKLTGTIYQTIYIQIRDHELQEQMITCKTQENTLHLLQFTVTNVWFRLARYHDV